MELSNNISSYIKTVFGSDYLTKYKQFFESKYSTTLRFSIPLEEQEVIITELQKYGIELQPIKSVPNAYYVIEGEDIVGKTLEHSIGKYYIQSLSSMIPPIVLNPNKNDIVMDLCAAPGSKSTQLAKLMNNEGTLYSNEPNLNRVKALVHNLDKMNAVNMGVLKQRGEILSKYFEEYFDKILVDAPCSALGVVQKKNEVTKWWETERVDRISELQLKLLISAIKMAKIGAEIVYSTCTLTVEENEFVVNKVLEKYPVELVEFEIDVPYKPGFTEVNGFKFHPSLAKTKRILPWEIKSEGFFISKLIKIDKTEPTIKAKLTKSKKKILKSNSTSIRKYINDIQNHFNIPNDVFNKYQYILLGNNINFVSNNWNEYNPDFFERIGTKFGLIDKNNFGRLHSHAAQIIGKYAEKNIFELKNEDELRQYFLGGIIKRTVVEKGQKIVKYKDMFLGTGVALKDSFKSQFPRSKRANDII
jgi:16S rRNA (cytosine1407-C5)-methyltransferase